MSWGGQGRLDLLYSYLASTGISSSESLLSALNTADTGLGRGIGGIAAWGRLAEEESDILIPKPLPWVFEIVEGL